MKPLSWFLSRVHPSNSVRFHPNQKYPYSHTAAIPLFNTNCSAQISKFFRTKYRNRSIITFLTTFSKAIFHFCPHFAEITEVPLVSQRKRTKISVLRARFWPKARAVLHNHCCAIQNRHRNFIVLQRRCLWWYQCGIRRLLSHHKKQNVPLPTNRCTTRQRNRSHCFQLKPTRTLLNKGNVKTNAFRW